MNPMLLCRDKPDTSALQYPVYAFPKLDGIRCLIVDGVPKTRTMKEVPNRYIREALSKPEYEGFDGELIVGDACSKSVYRDTNSVVMSHDKTDYFYYFVFDKWDDNGNFLSRYNRLVHRDHELPENIIILSGVHCRNEEELLNYEQTCLSNGYEGVVIRNMFAKYKQGRTTMAENNTYKLKRFVDSEAEVVGMIEEMENTNEKVTNEVGQSQRSSAASGLRGKGRMGALIVRDLETNVVFQIGSGFTEEERRWFWNESGERLVGVPLIIKYKSFMIGVKDKPRHPIYLGLRNKRDM